LVNLFFFNQQTKQFKRYLFKDINTGGVKLNLRSKDDQSFFIPLEAVNIGQNKGGKVVYGYEMFSQQALRQLKGWLDRPLDEELILSSIESFSFL